VLTSGYGTTSYTPYLSSTTTYYAQSRNTTTGCTSPTRTAVVAIINSIPSSPTAGDNYRYGTGSITITANPGTGATVDWYAASSGGSVLTSGYGTTSYTSTLSSTTAFYAQARNTSSDCISSSRTAVIATINPATPPHSPTAGNGGGCNGGVYTITATPDNSTGTETVDWYSSSKGGTLQYQSTTSITTNFSTTTTYYAESRNVATSAVCSTRTPVSCFISWEAPIAVSPADGAHQIGNNPAYYWTYQDYDCADYYLLEISDDQNFNSIYDSKMVYWADTLPVYGNISLNTCQNIYWRVSAYKGGPFKRSNVNHCMVNPCRKGDPNSEENTNIFVDDVKIINNPNPFSEWTVIEYTVSENDNVSINLYSVIGEKIPIIESEFKSAGNYSINFNSEKLSDGIYRLILQNGTQQATCNMVVIK